MPSWVVDVIGSLFFFLGVKLETERWSHLWKVNTLSREVADIYRDLRAPQSVMYVFLLHEHSIFPSPREVSGSW